MEKVIPRGVPTISYVRILNQEQNGQVSDIGIDGDYVSIMESGQVKLFHFLSFFLFLFIFILFLFLYFSQLHDMKLHIFLNVVYLIKNFVKQQLDKKLVQLWVLL